MIAESNKFIAVLDTCVLAPMPLCDTLLRMAEDPAFYIPKWSIDILRELRSTLQRMGYSAAQAERRMSAMETAFEDARVTGYDSLAASMTNDPKDRHVLAAAVRCGAHAIVTSNFKHFSPESVSPYDIAVLTPEDFPIHKFHLNEQLFVEKLVVQAAARGVSLADLLARLTKWEPNVVRLLADRR